MKGTTEVNELEEVDLTVDLGFDEDARARLIGEIVRDWIATLGTDKAWVRDQVVEVTPAVRSGHGQPGLPRGTGRNALGIAGGHLLGSSQSPRRADANDAPRRLNIQMTNEA